MAIPRRCSRTIRFLGAIQVMVVIHINGTQAIAVELVVIRQCLVPPHQLIPLLLMIVIGYRFFPAVVLHMITRWEEHNGISLM